MMRHRQRAPLFALLTANAISSIGNNFTTVVIPWFVLQTTGSAAKTGITLATGIVPTVLAGLFGGALVDRLGYRRGSVAADIASGAAVALIPLLTQTVGLAFWQLLVLVFLRTLLNAPGAAARLSLIPDLARDAEMPLERVNSLVQAAQRFALLLGPPLAGLLIVALGATNVLWLDAISFAISALLVAGAGVTAPKRGKPLARPSYREEMWEGFRLIHRDRLLVWLVFTFALGSLLSEPIYIVAFPVYAQRVYGNAVDLGFMYSALAVGSLGGLVVYSVAGPRLPRRGTLIGGFLVRAVSFWVFVLLPAFPIVAAAIIVNAVCFEPINPLWTSIAQVRVPAGMRGRFFSATAAIAGATLPLGTLGGGFMLGGLGLAPTLAVIAAASTIQAVSLLFIPALRTMDAVHPVLPQEVVVSDSKA